MENLSLYVHIPFCESKCNYCNFISFKKNKKCKEEYINYLIKEISLNSNKNYLVKTIFIGGGTPSCLNNGDILKISKAIKENFVVDKDAEFTIEANPNSFTQEKAQEYKKAGINRVSFGLQSANNKLLKIINRIHTKKDFVNAVNLATQAGILTINSDNHPSSLELADSWYLDSFSSNELSFSTKSYIIAVNSYSDKRMPENDLVKVAEELQIWK